MKAKENIEIDRVVEVVSLKPEGTFIKGGGLGAEKGSIIAEDIHMSFVRTAHVRQQEHSLSAMC